MALRSVWGALSLAQDVRANVDFVYIHDAMGGRPLLCDGGSTIDRDPSTEIAGTEDPALFLSEHYAMDAFACKVPNGTYLAKLYFAETFEGIYGAGERVFSFNVQGHEFKDFDIWVKAGGPNRADVETVPVEVTNGEFRITFTSQIQNPAINAIELIPQAPAMSAATPLSRPAVARNTSGVPIHTTRSG